MITTLAALAVVCLLSLAFILVIPRFAATKVFMRFLPCDIREAAKKHPDPSAGRQVIGYLLTALAAAGYAGLLFFLGADGLRRGYGFWLLFGRFMLFMYGYKLFDILVQDQYIVITKKYFVPFYAFLTEGKNEHVENHVSDRHRRAPALRRVRLPADLSAPRTVPF